MVDNEYRNLLSPVWSRYKRAGRRRKNIPGEKRRIARTEPKNPTMPEGVGGIRPLAIVGMAGPKRFIRGRLLLSKGKKFFLQKKLPAGGENGNI